MSTKQLPTDLHLMCYACEIVRTSHVCLYKWGELVIQICLWGGCIKIDTGQLLKSVDRLVYIVHAADALHHAFPGKMPRPQIGPFAWVRASCFDPNLKPPINGSLG